MATVASVDYINTAAYTQSRILKFKASIKTLKAAITTFEDMKVNHFHLDVKLDSIDTLIDMYREAVRDYEGYISQLEGEL